MEELTQPDDKNRMNPTHMGKPIGLIQKLNLESEISYKVGTTPRNKIKIVFLAIDMVKIIFPVILRALMAERLLTGLPVLMEKSPRETSQPLS